MLFTNVTNILCVFCFSSLEDSKLLFIQQIHITDRKWKKVYIEHNIIIARKSEKLKINQELTQ